MQSNPMPEPVESVIHAFMMSLGDLEPTWETIEHTDHNRKYSSSGLLEIYWVIFSMQKITISVLLDVLKMSLEDLKLTKFVLIDFFKPQL